MFKILCVIIMSLCFCQYAIADTTNDNENNNSLTLIGPIHNHIPGEQHIIHDSRGASPHLMSAPYGELPAYFGPFSEKGNWNCQADSVLLFLLMNNRTYKITDGYWNPTYSKSSVDIMASKKFEPRNTVMVLNGVQELRGMHYNFIASITCHGDRKTTTIECFKQAVYETGTAGANVFVILRASHDHGVYSSTIGLGGSAAGNLGQGGKEAYAIGSAIGFARNDGGPTTKPYIHGVALMIPCTDLAKFKNLVTNQQ